MGELRKQRLAENVGFAEEDGDGVLDLGSLPEQKITMTL